MDGGWSGALAALELFGETAGGTPVERVRITRQGLTAWVLTWGAVVQDLRLDGVPHPLVLGFPSFPPYLESTAYFGAIVGRLANRIAGGRASIAGRLHRLDRNDGGRHSLHGGSDGSGYRLWQLEETGEDFATLRCALPDGHMGFPGALDATATYRIAAGPALVLDLSAETDAETLCGFAHHSYFNLDGAATIHDHRLRIAAEAVLPVDDELIPTGEVMQVAGTPFDFRTPRPIGAAGIAYDHNFCLSEERRPLRAVAELIGPRSGLTLALATTEPGLQVYTAAALSSGATPGLAGTPYGPFAGVALEPQVWPDAPNRPWSAQARLRPGEAYRQTSVFRFSRSLAETG